MSKIEEEVDSAAATVAAAASAVKEQDAESCFQYEICSNWDIKWVFSEKKEPAQIAEELASRLRYSNESVQVKVEQAIDKLESSYYQKKYDNRSTSTTTIVPKSEAKRAKSIRKITEKTIKDLKIKLSDISKELGEDKNSMKLWFRKKLESSEDNARILEKCRKWIFKKIGNMDFEEFLRIVSKYTKSFQKEEAKRYKIEDPSTIVKKAYVMYPSPPGEKYSRNAHLMLYQTSHAESGSNLVHIDIKLSFQYESDSENGSSSQAGVSEINPRENFLNTYPGLSLQNSTPVQSGGQNQEQAEQVIVPAEKEMKTMTIQERVMWDVAQSEQSYILRHAYYFVKDIIVEYKLNKITKPAIQQMWVQTCEQISTQLVDKRIFLASLKAVCQFNSSEMANPSQTNATQKEQLILINILLKDAQGSIIHKESFEWDILSDINNAESFAEILVQDLSLENKYAAEIARQIRDQIMNYLSAKADKIGKFYPEFSKTDPADAWTRVREKEFMKKRLIWAMNEEVPLMPEEYTNSDIPKFQNQEMFSLLKAHLDVMPPKFQDKLIAIEKIQVATQVNRGADQATLNIDRAMRYLNPLSQLQNNPYIPQILREHKHINDLELELDKKRAAFTNPLLAASMN